MATISLHFQKMNSENYGLQRHNERQPGRKHSNKNIKKELTSQNTNFGPQVYSSSSSYAERVDAILKENWNNTYTRKLRNGETKTIERKLRKDAVTIVSTTVNFGGLDESFDDYDSLLTESANYLNKHYKHMVFCDFHVDEETPHLHYGFVPLTEDGKLNAKEVVMSKEKLTKSQEDFLNHMQQKFPNLNFDRQSLKDKVAKDGTNYEVYQEMSATKKNLEKKEKSLAQREKDFKTSSEALRGSLRDDKLNHDILYQKKKDELREADRRLKLKAEKLAEKELRLEKRLEQAKQAYDSNYKAYQRKAASDFYAYRDDAIKSSKKKAKERLDDFEL